MKNEHTESTKERNDLAMIMMSEAAWERNEERHKKEKKNLLIVLAITVVLLALSNICWMKHAKQIEAEHKITMSHINE